MIVTIDGPAGAGKSTIARQLAHRLGFRFLDTGAMYRAVALAGLRRNVDFRDERALADLAENLEIEINGEQVLVDGENVAAQIRSTGVTQAVRFAANNLRVRRRLGELQRQAVQNTNAVTEGRDQGTVVFPQAECKVFLTALPEERARRRQRDLHLRGEDVDWQDVLLQQERRDAEDRSRKVGGLSTAADAIEVCTDGLTIEEVVDRLEGLVKSKAASP